MKTYLVAVNAMKSKTASVQYIIEQTGDIFLGWEQLSDLQDSFLILFQEESRTGETPLTLLSAFCKIVLKNRRFATAKMAVALMDLNPSDLSALPVDLLAFMGKYTQENEIMMNKAFVKALQETYQSIENKEDFPAVTSIEGPLALNCETTRDQLFKIHIS